MLPAFDTLSGLPYPSVNLKQRIGVGDVWSPDQISTAEVATLQLEFRYLSHVSGDERYWKKVEHAMAVVRNATKDGRLSSIQGLVPIYMR